MKKTSEAQMQCCFCEEMIHAYATRCPYCYKDINPVGEVPSEQVNPSPFLRMEDNGAQEEKGRKEEKAPMVISQTVYMFLSLAALLAGSVFFFFGVLIRLFSKDGAFTLEWSAGSWSYFVFSALALLACGMVTLSKVEK
jgi:hypothetical protein